MSEVQESPTSKEVVGKPTLEELQEVFKRHNPEFPIWYYDPETKELIKGANIVPDDEDHKYVERLLYVGSKDVYDKFVKEFGCTEFFPGMCSSSKIVQVGRNPETKEWYGWTHRGYGKFFIGKEVVEGSMLADAFAAGYSPQTEEHCKIMAKVFADMLD